ncbi:hypothetical protein EDB86DRAFT_3093792 [Lactarius hatsudake]|nr:hypothetical protein EDB86DRAFT_3093792 [Lactarius hatsudake]
MRHIFIGTFFVGTTTSCATGKEFLGSLTALGTLLFFGIFMSHECDSARPTIFGSAAQHVGPHFAWNREGIYFHPLWSPPPPHRSPPLLRRESGARVRLGQVLQCCQRHRFPCRYCHLNIAHDQPDPMSFDWQLRVYRTNLAQPGESVTFAFLLMLVLTSAFLSFLLLQYHEGFDIQESL